VGSPSHLGRPRLCRDRPLAMFASICYSARRIATRDYMASQIGNVAIDPPCEVQAQAYSRCLEKNVRQVDEFQPRRRAVALRALPVDGPATSY
jgi:hypothetical protein